MRLKALEDTNFQDYKVCSMFLGTTSCTWKCGKENCQNHPLENARIFDEHEVDIVHRYLANPLTSAIVIGGLEPFDQWEELQAFVRVFRRLCDDDIVIYTGYTEEEIQLQTFYLRSYPNIVIKYGRYIAGYEPHYDNVLGVNLASPNQYAVRIS